MARTAKKKAVKWWKNRPVEGLIINVGWQGDGGVYELDLESRELIQERFPEANIIRVMLIDYDEKQDYERFHRPYWPQIARMLTGLTDSQIAQLGGVRIYDPGEDRVLWEWVPCATTRLG